MCWFVKSISDTYNRLEMSRRKQANPAKLDPQEDDDPSTFHTLRLTEDETAGSSSGSVRSRSVEPNFEGSLRGAGERDEADTKFGPYKCSLCTERFFKEKQLREHEQTHTDHLQFTCAYCPRLFKHKRSRDRHTKLHTGDKKYKCQQCESAFSRSDHLKIHMKTHDSRKPYKCGTCNRGYNTAAALSSHQQSHLKQESRSGSRTSGDSTPSPGCFRCIHCSETFDKSDLLQNHISLVHSDTESSQSQLSEHFSEYQTQMDELKIVCMYCAKEFPSLESMYQHVSVAHRDVPNGVPSTLSTPSPKISAPPKAETVPNGVQAYHCDRCTMKFDSHQNLIDHINIIHWRPIVSPNFTLVPNYPSFQTQPTDLSRKKKNKDDSGDKSAKKKKQDSTNILSPYDTNDKPCICSCCYAQLPNFKSFLLHMESHMVATNNTLMGLCPVCGEPGRDPISFNNHIFDHVIVQATGRCCYICNKSFERTDELQKHLFETHVVSVYKCLICNEIFDTKISMQIHMTSKHGDECKHFKCYLCSNQVFHDRLSAELHISMKHWDQFTPTSVTQSFMRTQYQLELDARLRGLAAIFQCTFCHKTFKDQYSQYVHILKEHNDNKEAEKFIIDSALYHQRNPSASPNFFFPKIATSSPIEKSKIDNGSNPYSCDVCNRTDILNENDLLAHKKLHHKSKLSSVSLQCAYCNEYCKSRSDLENHMKTHQVGSGKQGKHKCNICDEIYSSALTLADHKLSHCKIVEGNNCVQCKSLLVDEQSFYNHQLQHTTSSNKTQMTQIALPANCVICCQTLQTDLEIKLHAKFHLKHLVEKETLCSICNKIVDNHKDHNASNFSVVLCNDCKDKKIEPENDRKHFENDLENTVSIYDGVNLECHLCKQIFPSSFQLQTHLIEHNFYGMNQYSCYVCSSVFTAASGLQNHIVGHGLDSRPYECWRCHMKFFFRAELDNHKWIHIGKPTSSPKSPNTSYQTNGYDDHKIPPFFIQQTNRYQFEPSPKIEQNEVDVIDNNIKQENDDVIKQEDSIKEENCSNCSSSKTHYGDN